MIFMLWYVFINSEDLDSAPSSSTQNNATFLSWLLNVVTRNFRMSRDGRFLLDGNLKGYEALEHISKKSRGKSTDAFIIEKWTIHMNHEPREKFWDISGWTSGNFSCLGQKTNREGFFQVREICWNTSHESFFLRSF